MFSLLGLIIRAFLFWGTIRAAHDSYHAGGAWVWWLVLAFLIAAVTVKYTGTKQ